MPWKEKQLLLPWQPNRQKTLFSQKSKRGYKRLFLICFRQVSIEQIQTSIIHIPHCSQEIIDNENPHFDGKLIKIIKEHMY
jgi:hypothetical protein